MSTLRDWARCLHLDTGTLTSVIQLMKVKGKGLTEMDRLTVLTFDEIYVSNRISIDPEMQQVIGPHKTCQVVMARGLVNKWKQPVFYRYDQNMTVDIMFEVISKLYDAGFIVECITSDMGLGNTVFWSKLNVHYDNVSFPHPVNKDLKIYVFADVPHLLKLLRNHLLDNSFTNNGIKIDKTCLERLLQASQSDIKIAFKISRYHLDVKIQ